MVLLKFEYYLSKGVVRKRRKDKALAESLLKSSKDRMEFAKNILKNKPKYALEMAYEAVIEIIDALLALEGFKSWSHEANISFLRKKGFEEIEVRRMDLIRKKRHSSKYYGVWFNYEEVKLEIDFLEKIFAKIVKIVEEKFKKERI